MKLPEVSSLVETQSGQKSIDEWKKTTCKDSGMSAVREMDTFDTFLSHLGIILDIVTQDQKNLFLKKILATGYQLIST